MSLEVSLRLLRIFAAVAREGNVGRAAKRLYVSQPSLSQDVRRLEKLVGVSLFARTSRGMELTASGEALMAGVSSALLSIDRAVAEAAAVGGAVERMVTIAFSPSVGNRLMPTLLPVLDRLAPDIAVNEREVDTGEVGPGVRDGHYDLGFAHCPARDPELIGSLLAHERMCVALAADHHLATPHGVRLADLEGLDLVLWPRETAPEYYDHLLETCHKAGLEPGIVPGPRRAVIRSYLLAPGTTFCLLPASITHLHVPGVTFVQIIDRHASVPLVALRRADDKRRDVLAVEKVARDWSDTLLAP
jgi:DNA-binding transcriptional LysR family regulator